MRLRSWSRSTLDYTVSALIPIFVLGGSATAVLSHADRGLMGGQLVDSGSLHVEFVGSPKDEILFFAISDGRQKPLNIGIKSAGAMAEYNGKNTPIALSASGEGMLSSTGGKAIRAGSRVVFVANLADGETVNASFMYK